MPDFESPKPKPNSLTCCAAWHLQKHGLPLAIYDKIGALTEGGTRPYFTSTKKMAQYFGRNPSVVRRAFAFLHSKGWLVAEKGGDKDIKVRRYVKHEDWANDPKHKNKCFVSEQDPPWANTGDPLVGRIWATLEGKVQIHEGVLKKIRNLPISEADFLELLREEWVIANMDKAIGVKSRAATPASVLWVVIRKVSGVKRAP